MLGGVVGHKKVFDLIELSCSQFRKLPDRRLVDRRVRHTDESVIGDRAAFLGLARDDHSDQAGRDEATWKCRLVHDDDHVERVTVFPSSARYRAEIVWKDMSCRQYTRELEAAQRFVELELVTAATGCVDDDVDELRVGFPGWNVLK